MINNISEFEILIQAVDRSIVLSEHVALSHKQSSQTICLLKICAGALQTWDQARARCQGLWSRD